MTNEKKKTIDDLMQELKDACQYFLNAKNTLKEKDDYYTFIFNTAKKIYLEGGKNKTGFYYAFYECKFFNVFREYTISNGVLFGSYDKGKSIYLMQESNDSLKNIVDYSEWVKEKREKEKQEREKEKENLLKNDFKLFDLSKIKTLEQVDFYILKLQKIKKDLKNQTVNE